MRALHLEACELRRALESLLAFAPFQRNRAAWLEELGIPQDVVKRARRLESTTKGKKT
jgi:hypothetical protein